MRGNGVFSYRQINRKGDGRGYGGATFNHATSFAYITFNNGAMDDVCPVPTGGKLNNVVGLLSTDPSDLRCLLIQELVHVRKF